MPQNSPTTTLEQFTVWDIARAAAAKFDGQWSTEPGPWWVSSKVEDTAGHSFTVGVDDEGILYVCPEGYVFDRNTAFMYRLTKEGGLAVAAEAVADAIRKLLPLT
ncbi:hypothetical protein [Streptomyces phaeochromogenes]|jgi:hypothetical protein|uniref:hypothetical protein n=1 Tax=Streptomyces TaxID=1883 RepID=UPI00224E66EE|nr:hypothetical protein [Streptomyces phaeochromogenes]MCX4561703.1 hypothetical protein [Streptomyces phaeochromogenes]MCX5605973.1 hypothetical protein [Streptomyces phaeochromogenes]WSW18365.1 hypothetical protein OG277_38410 [Streptomyces phaeochromogenes]